MTRRFDSDRLLLATHNEGKRREIADLLKLFSVEVTSAGELGLPVPDETETSFEGNARIKAHASAKASDLPALSDDSGLAVDALHGAPGVYTADWAETGSGRDFGMAMTRVRNELDAVEVAFPTPARFICALCLAWPDGEDVVFLGEVQGNVVWPPRGEQGFGYDPMFVPEGFNKTFGEMEPATKHGMSHRAAAFRKLVGACFG